VVGLVPGLVGLVPAPVGLGPFVSGNSLLTLCVLLCEPCGPGDGFTGGGFCTVDAGFGAAALAAGAGLAGGCCAAKKENDETTTNHDPANIPIHLFVFMSLPPYGFLYDGFCMATKRMLWRPDPVF
jgi:hypothetical protein